jgi:hypothetical protein
MKGRIQFLKTTIIIAVVIVFAALGFYFWKNHQHTSITQSTTPNCNQVNGGGGTITAISGNNVTTHDSRSNHTTTIIISPYTNYYEPDRLTPVASSSLIVIGQTISAAGEGCDLDSNGFPATINAFPGIVWRVPNLPNISAPAGWYAHPLGTSETVFTRETNLSISQATEGYALGEQIDANAVPLDRRPTDWAGLNIGNASGTMGAPSANDWGSLNGYQTIKAEIGTEADNELIYAIFDPTQYTVYEFTLYPYPNATDTPILDELVKEFAKSLK